MKKYTPTDSAEKKGFNDVPSDKEQSRYKDFGKLVHNHERMTRPLYKKPLYKDKRSLLVILLILLVLYIVMSLEQ